MKSLTDILEKIKLPPLTGHLIFWPTAVCGVALDLWSKYAVFDWLEKKQQMSFAVIEGFLNLVLAVNRGAAFGIAEGKRFFLVAVSIIALIVLLGFFFFAGKQKKCTYFILGLFAAGITGNLYDRIFNDGMVRDFIDVYYKNHHWPAFNAADSMLCVAAFLLIITSFISDSISRKRAQQHKSGS